MISTSTKAIVSANNLPRTCVVSLTAIVTVVREELEYCGDVPLEITEQDAEVRYLSECKWEYSTSSESLLYYGRDLDTTLTCWAEGEPVLENP